MISYTLICDKDHEFAHHFDGYDDCMAQLKAGKVTCPTCGSKTISKGLSAPNVGGKSAQPAAPSCPAAGGCMNGMCGLNR
ncbi:MAG: DUF1178 family protein [Alphaproteobacteria bacterium]|nr:DUF1178 family protein [Alphaproteobacteria bacterium]MBF0249788.1 DUF1178 family protein [Alphaproteobacteria bacterium]